LRGNNGEESMLLDERGNMCCLGFLGEACGVKHMHLKILPSEIGDEYREAGQGWLFDRLNNERMQVLLIKVNDADGADENDRENWIAEGFKCLSGGAWDVEFIDGPVTP
jgi:hypothetical protein